ncbi:hypothetical protein MMC07_008410 [Pseudocyphellaria aurata]|nr:hypothetical protein [Pseudocyphellaria aurata]
MEVDAPVFNQPDDLDDATALLILQLQSYDIEELLRPVTSKGRDGVQSDADLALAAYQNEIEHEYSFLADQRMSRSLAQAPPSEVASLHESLAQEDTAVVYSHCTTTSAASEQHVQPAENIPAQSARTMPTAVTVLKTLEFNKPSKRVGSTVGSGVRIAEDSSNLLPDATISPVPVVHNFVMNVERPGRHVIAQCGTKITNKSMKLLPISERNIIAHTKLGVGFLGHTYVKHAILSSRISFIGVGNVDFWPAPGADATDSETIVKDEQHRKAS